MKRISLIVLLLSPVLAMISCRYEVPVLPGSGGKTCEIIAVMPKDYWDGQTGNSIRNFFGETQPGLNQPEPRFSVVNITPQQFNESEMFRHHRNIIIVEFHTEGKTGYELFQDAWAYPQIVAKFSVPEQKAFDSLFSLRKERLMAAVYAKEYQRIQKVFKSGQALDVSNRLLSGYGFNLIFPDGFGFSAADRNFGWIRKESKDFGQGIIFSIRPYTTPKAFEKDSILAERNRICGKIPGPAEGSYMSTETACPEYSPVSRVIDLNGFYAVETRGLWRLEGDFMGGPFVNYLIADTANARLIMLDAYLYSPRKPKRDLLMQLEGIAHSFTTAAKTADSIQ